MRLEIDDDVIANAKKVYTGPETTGKGLVTWLLIRFAKMEAAEAREFSDAEPLGVTS